MICLIVAIVNLIRWIKNNPAKDGEQFRDKARFEYLKKLDSKYELITAFKNLLKVESIDANFDKNITEIFDTKIKGLIANKDFETVATLLTTFYENLPKRDELNLIYLYLGDVLDWWPKLLTISKNLDESKKENFTKAFSLENSLEMLEQIIIYVVRIGLRNNQYIRLLFPELENFAKKLQDKKFEQDKIMIANLYDKICETIVEEIDKIGVDKNTNLKYEIKNRFPSDWKITEETVQLNNLMTRSWFKVFINWCRERLTIENKDIEGFDTKAELLSEILFPDVNRESLSNFIVAIFLSDKENSANLIIEEGWGFGIIGATKSPYDLIVKLVENEWIVLEKPLVLRSGFNPVVSSYGYILDRQFTIKLLENVLKPSFESLLKDKPDKKDEIDKYLEMINEVLKRLKEEN